MRVSDHIKCSEFPCVDIRRECHVIPSINVDPKDVSIVLISEAAPADSSDYYYAGGDPLFQQTTVQAFRDAGAEVSSIQDIVGLGVYLTTAVKCGKIGYGIKAATIKECSLILEKEIDLFPEVQERAYSSALILTVIILSICLISRLLTRRHRRHVIK